MERGRVSRTDLSFAKEMHFLDWQRTSLANSVATLSADEFVRELASLAISICVQAGEAALSWSQGTDGVTCRQKTLLRPSVADPHARTPPGSKH